jgi:hypothetical protein
LAVFFEFAVIFVGNRPVKIDICFEGLGGILVFYDLGTFSIAAQINALARCGNM